MCSFISGAPRFQAVSIARLSSCVFDRVFVPQPRPQAQRSSPAGMAIIIHRRGPSRRRRIPAPFPRAGSACLSETERVISHGGFRGCPGRTVSPQVSHRPALLANCTPRDARGHQVVSAGCAAPAFGQVSQWTRRWRKADSNLYGAFLSMVVFGLFGGSLFGAGRAVLRPVPPPLLRSVPDRAEGVK